MSLHPDLHMNLVSVLYAHPLDMVYTATKGISPLHPPKFWHLSIKEMSLEAKSEVDVTLIST